MRPRDVVTALGSVCIAAGIGCSILGFMQSRGTPPVSLVSTDASNALGVVGAALYTQNFQFIDPPNIVLGTAAGEAIVHARMRADFVERAVLALDRAAAHCEQRIDEGEPRVLHVFALPTLPPAYAVAFFLHGKGGRAARVGRDVVDCVLADSQVGSLETNARILGAVDSLVARSRLEYLVRPALRDEARRFYPADDRTLRRYVR